MVVLLVLLTLLLSAPVAAQQEQLITPGGPLIIKQLDKRLLGSSFVVMLGEREVIRTEEGDENATFPRFPVPRVIAYAEKGIPPFSAVAVFQQFSWGNACNGGPIWFLGIHRDGTFWASNPIDFCGGASPIVSVTPDAIRVILPASDLENGSAPIPKSEWVLFQGKVELAR
jgi:hypothetical protein